MSPVLKRQQFSNALISPQNSQYFPHGGTFPPVTGADLGFRRGGGFVQEFRLENRSYPDVHDFSLRMLMQIILQTAVGGGPSTPPPPKKKKTVSAPGLRTPGLEGQRLGQIGGDDEQ